MSVLKNRRKRRREKLGRIKERGEVEKKEGCVEVVKRKKKEEKEEEDEKKLKKKESESGRRK